MTNPKLIARIYEGLEMWAGNEKHTGGITPDAIAEATANDDETIIVDGELNFASLVGEIHDALKHHYVEK